MESITTKLAIYSAKNTASGVFKSAKKGLGLEEEKEENSWFRSSEQKKEKKVEEPESTSKKSFKKINRKSE